MTTCPGGVDHCVQAVGVDTSVVGGYWKVQCRQTRGPTLQLTHDLT
jgi:hypothetical protein